MSFTPHEPAATACAAAEVAHPPPVFVTAADIAALLRISRRTVFRLRACGDLPPPVKLSRHVVRWRWVEVCDYLVRLKSRNTGRPPVTNTPRRKGVQA